MILNIDYATDQREDDPHDDNEYTLVYTSIYGKCVLENGTPTHIGNKHTFMWSGIF